MGPSCGNLGFCRGVLVAGWFFFIGNSEVFGSF
jgi:hypothetical protein